MTKDAKGMEIEAGDGVLVTDYAGGSYLGTVVRIATEFDESHRGDCIIEGEQPSALWPVAVRLSDAVTAETRYYPGDRLDVLVRGGRRIAETVIVGEMP
jgi:hypothetical protein